MPNPEPPKTTISHPTVRVHSHISDVPRRAEPNTPIEHQVDGRYHSGIHTIKKYRRRFKQSTSYSYMSSIINNSKKFHFIK